MRAQILSIGSELILGHLTDTNATYLAQQLAGLGIELTLVTQVGDDLPRLTEAVRRAASEAELVVCTGGVGPTADDLTREAIAAVAGEEPVVQPDLLATIEAFFRARGLEMPERNRKQAWLIPSAEALPNPVGTAPGWFARIGGAMVVAMPGVPREMFRMWREQAVPRILAAEGGARAIRTVTLRTIGIGESMVEQMLHDLVALEDPVVATYAKDDGVHVRVTAVASDAADAERTRDQAVAEVRRRLGRYIYGQDDTSLPEALANLLGAAGATVAVADRGGGGRFAALLASHPAAAAMLASSTMAPGGAELAADLAARALGLGGTVGVGVRVEVAPAAESVFEGAIEVAVAGPVTLEERTPMRSGWEDIQRRSALLAADLLRRTLSPSGAP